MASTPCLLVCWLTTAFVLFRTYLASEADCDNMGKIHLLSLQASISDESLRVCNTHTLKPSFGTGVRCDVAMMSILRRFGIH